MCRDSLLFLVVMFSCLVGLKSIRLIYLRSPNKKLKSEKTENEIKCDNVIIEHKKHSYRVQDAFNLK